MADNEFGRRVRDLRIDCGMSQADLARHIPVNESYISRIESGKKLPHPDTAARLDDALHANGQLLALLPFRDRLTDVDHQTRELSALLGDGTPVGELVTAASADTERLAVDYLAQRGPKLIDEAKRLRAATKDLLRRARSPQQLRDAMLALGYQSGVLSYVALDSGAPRSAMASAELAWQAANRSGSDQLRAWVRGTQSLIGRFVGDYPTALAFAEDGLRYATSGSAAARLWAGVAQCRANMADAAGSRRALNEAARTHAQQRGMDEMPGLFTFSDAKLAYYSGSSLIWLPGRSDNAQARRQAHEAIRLWESSGPERSFADEALAHVYAATASLAVGDLESAAADLEPILGLPPERRISWIVKRMDRVREKLALPPFAGDRLAVELVDRIRDYR